MPLEPLKIIDGVFALERLDAGRFSAFRAGPMALTLEWYCARGLGNVSLMRGKAMGGLMRMDTLIIQSPLRDMPLFSCDLMSAMGHTLLIEYYDTLVDPRGFDPAPFEQVKSGCADIPDRDPGEHWYDGIKLPVSISKKGKKRFSPEMELALGQAVCAYVESAQKLPELSAADAEKKRGLTRAYVDGLLEKGGPSTDAFLKSLGPDDTRYIFEHMLFGTAD